MTPWSKKLYSCHICKTNYNRQSERIGKDPQLKAWWKSQDRNSRIEWFCKNKKTYEPNKRKAFDEPGHYEEESQMKGYSKKENMYDYLPRDTWLIRQMQLGLCGSGTLEQQRTIALAKYSEAVLDKTCPKLFENSEWCIGVFSGIRKAAGSEESSAQAWKRTKTIGDAVDLSASLELAEKDMAMQKEWIAKCKGTSNMNVCQTEGLDDSLAVLARAPAMQLLPEVAAHEDIFEHHAMKHFAVTMFLCCCIICLLVCMSMLRGFQAGVRGLRTESESMSLFNKLRLLSFHVVVRTGPH